MIKTIKNIFFKKKRALAPGETIGVGNTLVDYAGRQFTITKHRPSKGLYVSDGFEFTADNGRHYDRYGRARKASFIDDDFSAVAVIVE